MPDKNASGWITKFEIIDNSTFDNSKTSLKDFFYDFFAMNQGQSEE